MTRRLEKLTEKQTQHQKLVGDLELRSVNVKPMSSAFGLGGTVYKQFMEDMRQFGVRPTTVTRTMKEVHLHSATRATNIITQRRILDRQ